MTTQGDDDVWHAFYSERAQREYYYHPKTKVVTWIVPDEMYPDGSTFEPPIVINDTNHHSRDDNIPRGLVFVESHQKELNQTRRVLSGRALTFVLLTFSTLITSVFWGLQHESDHRVSHELLGEADKRENCSEKQNRTSRITQLGRGDEERDKKSTGTSSDGLLPDIHAILSNPEFGDQVLPSAALVLDVAAPTPVVVKWHNNSIERGDPQLDLCIEEKNILHQSTDNDVNSIEKEASNVEIQEAQPFDKTTDKISTSTIPSPTRTVEVVGSHLNPRGCFIPLAHLVSRKCRLAVKSRPLFDAQALVDSMMI